MEFFDYYAKMRFWTSDEAISLVLSFDPMKSLKTIDVRTGSAKYISRNPQYAKISELFARHWGQKEERPRLQSGYFLSGATYNEIDVPEELRVNVVKFHGEIPKWNPPHQKHEKKPSPLENKLAEKDALIVTLTEKIHLLEGAKGDNPKEKDSLLKMILGMAIEQYGYKPTQLRNPATANIETDIRTVGLSLDGDTIRKFLNEAKQLLPDGYKDD